MGMTIQYTASRMLKGSLFMKVLIFSVNAFLFWITVIRGCM
jgi:hypothetical protein